MTPIQWLEISLNVPAEQIDLVSAQLIGNGVPGLMVEEEADFLRFLEENRQYWDYVDDALLAQMKGVSRIKLYVSDDPDGEAQLVRYLEGISLPYESLPLKEDDWAYSWQKYYRPLAVGNRIFIVPEWEREAAVPSGRLPLYLNPGLSFGTGSHASTQLCLEALEGVVSADDRVLDLGSGSGILSIAALLLGASHVTAVDIDPKAVEVSRDNAALNSISAAQYQAMAGDVLSDTALLSKLSEKPVQLILANIVADVIIALADHAASLLVPGGFFLCSGIIDQREDDVRTALLARGLSIVERREKGGWLCLVCQRK